MTIRTLMLSATACCLGTPAIAATVWDESLNGDLSSSGLSPTSIAVGLGANDVLGTTGNSGSGIDRDYFSFTVPIDTVLTSIVVLGNTAVSGSVGFFAIQAGPQVTVSPSGAGAENLLGFAHYGNDFVGSDILPTILGFAGGLGTGTYSFWVQETGGPAPYGFQFNVAPVPLPGAAVLLLSGLFGVSMLRGRRRTAAQ